MDDRERIFYHELGHFVARELNHQYFNGPKTKSVEIYLHDRTLGLYSGELKIDSYENEKEKEAPERNRLAEYLASSTYGCFFQAYYLNQSVNDCMNRNGRGDYAVWIGSLEANNLDGHKSEFIAVENEYYRKLKSDNALSIFMSLNPWEFMNRVSEEADNYLVDVEKLRKVVRELNETHYSYYNELVTNFNQLIEQHT